MGERACAGAGLEEEAKGGMCGRGGCTRRPPFRVRPPLGRWGVARRFAYTQGSKAALCAGLKSRVRTAWRHFKEMISRVLENLPILPSPLVGRNACSPGKAGARAATRYQLATARASGG